MISEGSRGLFHRGIMMAGNALHNGYYEIPRRQWAQRLAMRLGFNSSSEAEILEFLENADPERIIWEQFFVASFEEKWSEGLSVVFGPTIEPFDTEGVFLNQDIPELVKNAWGNEIPILIGATSFESLSVLEILRLSEDFFDLLTDFENYVPRELNVTKGSESSLNYAAMLKSAYYGKLRPSMTNVDGTMLVSSDNLFWFPAHRTIKYRMEQNRAENFVYRFDADTDFNFLKVSIPGVDIYREPTHSEDMAHLFKSIMHKNLSDVSEESRKVLELMVTTFTNFAATGNPSAPDLNLHWPPVSKENELWIGRNFLMGMNIREDRNEFITLPESDRCEVFEKIFEMETKK
jgi:carboxylesterase type B